MYGRFLVSLATLLISPSVFAGWLFSDCPKQPKQTVMDVEMDVTAASEGLNKAIDLIDATLGIDLTHRNLMAEYPNPEKIILVQIILATVCRQLEDDDSLSASEKTDIIMTKLETALNPIKSRAPGAVRPILVSATTTDCQTVCSTRDMDAIQAEPSDLFACVDKIDHRFGFWWGRKCVWVKDNDDKRSADYLCPCLPRNLSLTQKIEISPAPN